MKNFEETRLWIIRRHGIVVLVSALILLIWTATAPGQLQYVAKTLILTNHVIHLRSSDLRPYWANNRLGERASSSSTATTGKRKTSEIKSFPLLLSEILAASLFSR